MTINNNNNTKKLPQFKERHIAKVSDRIHKYTETDPFLLMAEHVGVLTCVSQLAFPQWILLAS